jgi:Domain of unknown function (DUF4114)
LTNQNYKYTKYDDDFFKPKPKVNNMAITKKTLPQAIDALLVAVSFNNPLGAVKKNSVPFLPTLYLAMGLALNVNNAHATGWQYVGGSSNYDAATGQPNGLTNKSSVLPADLLSTVLSRLPEGQPIGNNPAALALLTNDEGANIFLKANANVKISYVSEGAGYLNSVGFFKFPKADLTTLSVSSIVDTIMFPNFSDNVLQFGQAVDIGNFVAGDAIGFTIVANGWMPYTAAIAAVPGVPATYYTTKTKGHKIGDLKTAAKPAIPAVPATGGMVDPNKAASKIFRTIKRFNPEPANASNLQAHTILFAYPEKELLVLAFEDLNRQSATNNDYGYASDNDFNDVIIAIHVTPFSAVDCTNCNLLVPPTCKTPVTVTPIPAEALTNSGKMVNICHYTASATNPWNAINISVNALNTHLTHHDDAFQINGACPPFTAGLCPTTTPPPVCAAPQVLNPATNACETPTTSTACTAPQAYNPVTQSCESCATGKTYNATTKSCETSTPVVCTAPQVLNPITNSCESCATGKTYNATTQSCETPVCTAPETYNPVTQTCTSTSTCNSSSSNWNAATGLCGSSTPTVCNAPEAYNVTTKSCESCLSAENYNPETKSCDNTVCTPPQVRDTATNTCITVKPARGESGPISWREITTPTEVNNDTNKAAKAAAKAAADTAKAAKNNGNGNGNTTAP